MGGDFSSMSTAEHRENNEHKDKRTCRIDDKNSVQHTCRTIIVIFTKRTRHGKLIAIDDLKE